MDTPEADISAIQSGRMAPLPVYQEHDTHDDILPLISTVDPLDTRHLPPSYDNKGIIPNNPAEATLTSEIGPDNIPAIYAHLDSGSLAQVLKDLEQANIEAAKYETVRGFFEAIDQQQDDAIALFLSRNLVTANTTTKDGKTPLLAAIETKNVRIVQQLLDAGAEPDVFGVTSFHQGYYSHQPLVAIQRTPLQLAASIGHLPLVKLFMEHYNCNDALVAPDGQIALRLAASNNHREVVDYLPSRRGGGFLRWRVQHAVAVKRTKRILRHMFEFCKFFVWDIEKFFLWTCPKHLIVRPLTKSCKWCWARKQNVGPWCKNQIRETPARIKRLGQKIMRGVKKIPKAISATAKAFWKFITVQLPKIIKKIASWLWIFITVRVPSAAEIIAKWIWNGVTTTSRAVWNVILKLVSLAHTFFSAIFTFFKSLTIQDIMNGVKNVLSAIFISLPKTLFSWLKKFGDVSCKALTMLLGTVGMIIWLLLVGIWWTITFLPVKLWEVLVSMMESLGTGLGEIIVWFRPKA